jgi:selenocysteine lyase/cysteine desulfurase
VLRDRFPIFERKTYLDSCSKGALSHEVRAAYLRYLDDWERDGSPWELWVETLERTRGAIARLLNADTAEIAVTTSVSAALSSLASAIDFGGARNRVVVSDFEFPTSAQVWHAQERRGARVVHAAERGGEIPLERFEALIDERTAVVAVTHVCYRNGARQDVEAIAALAHERGALFLLDAYQSLGTTPVDPRELGVDILVGGALKYLLGSSGLAFAYVREGLIADLPPTATGWFAQDDIFALDIHRHTPARSARRFESGTPSIPNLYAGLAGLELLLSVDQSAVARHLQTLTGALVAGARERGFRLATPSRHGPMIALRSHDVDTLVAHLAQRDIVASSRDGNLRVSPHLYNELGDIERLLAALVERADLLEAADADAIH